MSILRNCCALMNALLLAASAGAHHSAAMFDDKQCLTLTGTVQKINFSYPHAWLWIDVADARKGTVQWALENTDPSSLRIQGWAPGTVKKGDKLSLIVNPSRDGRMIASIKSTVLPDGRTIRAGGFVACPASAAVIKK
jgi:hypothetical protein